VPQQVNRSPAGYAKDRRGRSSVDWREQAEQLGETLGEDHALEMLRSIVFEADAIRSWMLKTLTELIERERGGLKSSDIAQGSFFRSVVRSSSSDLATGGNRSLRIRRGGQLPFASGARQ
jgi:hypothetical protein